MKPSIKKINTKKLKKVPFHKLSKSEKRVAIAKDVIAQIKRMKYIASKGSYISNISIPKLEDVEGWKVDGFKGKDVQKNFSKIKQCTVCALGACLMSATKFANQLEFGDVDETDAEVLVKNEKVKKLFKSLFTPEQLYIIEEAFEGNNQGSATRIGKMLGAKVSNKLLNKSREFYNLSGGDEERLIEIMENIIKNGGTFIP